MLMMQTFSLSTCQAIVVARLHTNMLFAHLFPTHELCVEVTHTLADRAILAQAQNHQAGLCLKDLYTMYVIYTLTEAAPSVLTLSPPERVFRQPGVPHAGMLPEGT